MGGSCLDGVSSWVAAVLLVTHVVCYFQKRGAKIGPSKCEWDVSLGY